MRIGILLALFCFGITACSGGGPDSLGCAYIGSETNAGVVNGTFDNVEAVADKNLGTFAEIASTGGGFISTRGSRFEGGTNAGVFVTPPSGTTSSDMTINTYLESALVQTATGPALTITSTGDRTAATDYVSMAATTPFDRVELAFANSGNSNYLVFEICASADVQ